MYRYLDNPTTTVPRSFPLVDAAGGPLLSMCTPCPNTTKWGPDKPITRFIPVSFQDAAPRGCSNAKCRPLPTPVSHKPQHHTTAINIYGLWKHGCVSPPVWAQPAWCCNSQIATAKSSINCPSAWRRRNKSGSTLRPWPSMPTFSSAPPSLPHDCSPHRTPNSHSSRRPDPHNLPLAAGTNRFTSPH